MRYTLLGLGVSNMAVLKDLLKNDEEVFVSELGKIPSEYKKILEENHVEYEEAGHTDRVFETDVLVVSPGINPNSDVIRRARKRGLKITTELEYSFDRIDPEKIIAVTGTNGKSTTTSLIAYILGQKYRVFEGGNLGTPLAEALNCPQCWDLLVVEVSSFQLTWCKRFKPHVGVLLNLAPDHLDWHSSFEEYAKTKISMFERQTTKDIALLNEKDEWIRRYADTLHSEVRWFNECAGYGVHVEGKFLHIEDIKLPFEEIKLGSHMLSNVVAAVSVARIVGLSSDEISDALKRFEGLPHRFKLVAEWEGIRFIDDSKATNAHAVLAALREFEDRSVVLIMSGKGKREDYSLLFDMIDRKCKAVVVFGEFVEYVTRMKNSVPVYVAKNMEEAVNRSVDMAEYGDTILLSPGGASFDLYSSYHERGEDFIRCVRKLIHRKKQEA